MSAITRIEIETKRLDNDISSLKAHLQNLSRKSDEMMAGIDSLSAMWEGAMHDTFTAQLRTDYETVKSVEHVLEELIQKLEYARDSYNTCESSVGAIIDSISV